LRAEKKLVVVSENNIRFNEELMNYFCKSMLILSFEVQSKNGGKHIYLVTVHFLQEEHGCQDDLQKYQVVSQHDEAGITYQSVCSIFLKDRHNIKAIISTI